MRDNLDLPVYPFNQPIFREARFTAPEGQLSAGLNLQEALRWLRSGWSFMLAAALCIACTGPAAAENVLRFRGMDATASTMDPHAYADKDNKGATKQVYEALLDVDSNLAIVPQLALAWKPLNPTTWEFELRPDVTLPRRHAVHRRGRGLQHRARARRRRPTSEPMSTASRRSRRSTITPSASRPPRRIRRCG